MGICNLFSSEYSAQDNHPLDFFYCILMDERDAYNSIGSPICECIKMVKVDQSMAELGRFIDRTRRTSHSLSNSAIVFLLFIVDLFFFSISSFVNEYITLKAQLSISHFPTSMTLVCVVRTPHDRQRLRDVDLACPDCFRSLCERRNHVLDWIDRAQTFEKAVLGKTRDSKSSVLWMDRPLRLRQCAHIS
ncbi:hypothetical protein HD554DRAFT_1225860 [Boletus coccyginus]|nr:hypothetical protein HD554DRAFT_1225860 [Boletus coccyginus]